MSNDMLALAECFEADQLRGYSPIRNFTAKERRLIVKALRSASAVDRSGAGREEIARIIEPTAYRLRDELLKDESIGFPNYESAEQLADKQINAALAKADAILSLHLVGKESVQTRFAESESTTHRESVTECSLRETLKEHWLTSVICNHEAKTDRAACFCGWVSKELPAVGKAVDAWIDHVARYTTAGALKLTTERSGNGNDFPETGNVFPKPATNHEQSGNEAYTEADEAVLRVARVIDPQAFDYRFKGNRDETIWLKNKKERIETAIDKARAILNFFPVAAWLLEWSNTNGDAGQSPYLKEADARHGAQNMERYWVGKVTTKVTPLYAPLSTDASAGRQCFWPKCSDHKRCAEFGSCVAIYQNKHKYELFPNHPAKQDAPDAHGDGYCGCTERCKARDNCEYDVKPPLDEDVVGDGGKLKRPPQIAQAIADRERQLKQLHDRYKNGPVNPLRPSTTPPSAVDGEPVAWRMRMRGSGGPWSVYSVDPGEDTQFDVEPLYAHPTPAEGVREALRALEPCEGEQYKFEEWAKGERYDMSEHPLHYLFLDSKTNAARKGWKAALRYALAAISPTKATGAES